MSEVRDIHLPLALWLNKQGIPFIRARSDRESTIAVGWPDFSLFMGNRFLLIEAKFEKGSLSVAQKRCHEALAKAGCKVHVVRKYEDAIELVNAWLSHEPTVEIQSRKTESLNYAGLEWVKDSSGGYVRKGST